MDQRRAFTLTEVLVVTAIIAVLGAILFPVFRSAQAAARSSACVSRFHQIGVATILYTSDYDDKLIPASWHPVNADPSLKNATWVQLALPYLREFSLTRCPEDHTRPNASLSIFDPDLTPQAVEQRLFEASIRSNAGYNFAYLAPQVRLGSQFTVVPRTTSQVGSPSQTLLMVDSVWEVDKMGRPHGGGKFIVTPPCRFAMRPDGRAVDTFAVADSEKEFWFEQTGWDSVGSSRATGNAYGWHGGWATTLRLDGSTKAQTMSQLTAGCDAVPGWKGLIASQERYMWDLD